jgi:hypothetical protein
MLAQQNANKHHDMSDEKLIDVVVDDQQDIYNWYKSCLSIRKQTCVFIKGTLRCKLEFNHQIQQSNDTNKADNVMLVWVSKCQ